MIYLASPYTHPDTAVRHERYLSARIATAALLRRGNAVFSPIVHSHPLVVDHGLPDTWDFWRPIDFQYLRLSTVLYVLAIDGWRESVGVTAEIEYARERNMPIFFIEPTAYSLNSEPDAAALAPSTLRSP